MKIRQGHVSNSSTCSFVIPLKLISKEQREKIWEWYSKKAEDTYMDDMGKSIEHNGQFLTGNIGYVRKEFLEYAEEIEIDRNDILLKDL